MRKLYHHILSPFCRKVRISLAEKGLQCDLISEDLSSRNPAFLTINPSGEIPVLIEGEGNTIPEHNVICEYLEEAYPDPSLLGKDLNDRVEVRRLTRWFDEKFAREVTSGLLIEKVIKSLRYSGTPNSVTIRTSKAFLREHLQYLEWLIVRRRWLAGDIFSYADISAASQISVIDYLGDVPWDKFPDAKDWYMRIKSRPSFRSILHDRQTGIIPPPYYSELDF